MSTSSRRGLLRHPTNAPLTYLSPAAVPSSEGSIVRRWHKTGVRSMTHLHRQLGPEWNTTHWLLIIIWNPPASFAFYDDSALLSCTFTIVADTYFTTVPGRWLSLTHAGVTEATAQNMRMTTKHYTNIHDYGGQRFHFFRFLVEALHAEEENMMQLLPWKNLKAISSDRHPNKSRSQCRE